MNMCDSTDTSKGFWSLLDSSQGGSQERLSLLPTADNHISTSYGSDNKLNESGSASTCTADSSESSYALPSPPRQTHKSDIIVNDITITKKPALSALQLAAIIFFSVSGGPFGVEESIRAAGPFYTILGFCIAPLVFSIPECLMAVELGSGGFQSSAAGCAWVEEAFGRNMGFLSGFLQWVSGATDNAIYPVLFLDYALQVFPNDEIDDLHSTTRFLIITGTSLGLAYMNWLGLDLVGNMSMVVCCIAMSPFVLLIIFGMSKVDPQRWLRVPSAYDAASVMEETSSDEVDGGFFPNAVVGGVLLRPFLNNLFWNFNSFDNAGSFSEDIQTPAKVLPQGMLLGLLMVVLGYLLPLLVALGTTGAAPEDWVDGYLATVTVETVGPWLGKFMIFAAALSNVGLFQAELSADAYMLMGMAERGYLPSFFAERSSNGTPTYSLLLGTVVIVLMGVSDLDSLIEMLNFNYALALILEYAAFIKLRISKPDVYRPCRVPLGTLGCAIALIPTIGTLVLVLALASYTTICASAVSICVGLVVYKLSQHSLAQNGSNERMAQFSEIC